MVAGAVDRDTGADKAIADIGEAGIRLPHLAGPAAMLRQVFAAHALRHCPEIIEIGGAGCPVTGFLTHRPASVAVIDPKILPFSGESLHGHPCRIRHVAAKVQQAGIVRPEGPFGLVLLGLSLKPFGSAGALDGVVLDLVANARTLVLDYALSLDRAQAQIAPIMALRDTPPVIDVSLDINDPLMVASGFSRRRLLVFGAI